MSFKNYLTIVVMCIAMSFFTNMISVNAIDCKGAYKTDSDHAYCTTDEQNVNTRTCSLNKCSHDNAPFVAWTGCVPQSGNGPAVSQNCVNYGYYDSKSYLCSNAKSDFFICPRKFGQKPFMSCDC
ncbi:uncharacterized protein MELLADRAFT_123274 [Melampsora larici-populina 98AG31]|uniref:Secreted protein n=1 Tax=Melampsora larici-populina (strain 98AG31 / pathotype 3-4-7) TaxID=747676 RepID=F4S1L6_MELLP|nr:uncharacterized protein MELLADRAFT_123274 [Melampsora larici-populina 98AG31]EGG01485.1 secreted protein [Melampsora larici-populina 98AG31]